MIRKSLKRWFFAHFITDMIFAIPLLFFPEKILSLFGMTGEPVTARLTGAALIGIGGTSLLTKTEQQYDIMLTLKILWSAAAIFGLMISVMLGAPGLVWVFIAIFAVFLVIWAYHKFTLER